VLWKTGESSTAPSLTSEVIVMNVRICFDGIDPIELRDCREKDWMWFVFFMLQQGERVIKVEILGF